MKNRTKIYWIELLLFFRKNWPVPAKKYGSCCCMRYWKNLGTIKRFLAKARLLMGAKTLEYSRQVEAFFGAGIKL